MPMRSSVSLAVLMSLASSLACGDETDDTERQAYVTFVVNSSWTKILDSQGNDVGTIVAIEEGPWMNGEALVFKAKKDKWFAYYETNWGKVDKRVASDYALTRLLRTKTDYKHVDIVNPKSDTLVINIFNHVVRSDAPQNIIEGHYFVHNCPVIAGSPWGGVHYEVAVE